MTLKSTVTTGRTVIVVALAALALLAAPAGTALAAGGAATGGAGGPLTAAAPPAADALAAGSAPDCTPGSEGTQDERPHVETYAGQPRVAAEDWTTTEIQAAHRCDRELPTTDVVAVGDTLVVSATVPGLQEAMWERNGSTSDAALRSLLSTDRLNVSALQTPQSVTPEREPKVLALAEDARVKHAYENRLMLVVDTGSLNASYVGDWNGGADENDPRPVSPGEGYRIRVTLDGVGANTTVQFDDREVRLDHRTGRLYRQPQPGATFTGDTALAPGTPLTVELRDGETGELLRQAEGTVLPSGDGADDERRFRATADLSSLAHGRTVTLSVHGPNADEPLASTPLELDEPRASVSMPAAQADGQGGFANVEGDLEVGGFYVLHAGSADGPVVATSERREAGLTDGVLRFDDLPASALNENGTVRLVAVAHRDSDGDGTFEAGVDRRYAAFVGESAVASATVAVPTDGQDTSTSTPTATPTPTPTVTPTPTMTPTDVHTPTGTPTPTDGGDGGDGGDGSSDGGSLPGFGILAALVALTAAALAARRGR